MSAACTLGLLQLPRQRQGRSVSLAKNLLARPPAAVAPSA